MREITTPTLPTFIQSSINLLSKATSTKSLENTSPLANAVLDSFATLLPRHPTLFRPMAYQIRNLIRPLLAPTVSDSRYVTSETSHKARDLAVLLHNTASKNTSGEEWGKAVRILSKEVHVTADQVFRAVVEDWESVAGHASEPVDVNEELRGGGNAPEDLPVWSGMTAGIDRLGGLLLCLKHYFSSPTTTAVNIPLGIISDLFTRILSLSPPNVVNGQFGGGRINASIDRDEREGLWAGLPQLHCAALQLMLSISDRLQEGFAPMAQACIDQLMWLFPSAQVNEKLRKYAYLLAARVLLSGGSMMPKTSVVRLAPLVRSCCNDLVPDADKKPEPMPASSNGEAVQKGKNNAGSTNADTFLGNRSSQQPVVLSSDTGLVSAATALLPVLLSHLPQKYLDISLRADIDRTAILLHHKDAMLASVLNPFVGKSGRALSSILPHLSRAYSQDLAVEGLIRPRMPPLPPLISMSEFEQNEEVMDAEETQVASIEQVYGEEILEDEMRVDPVDDFAVSSKRKASATGRAEEIVAAGFFPESTNNSAGSQSVAVPLAATSSGGNSGDTNIPSTKRQKLDAAHSVAEVPKLHETSARPVLTPIPTTTKALQAEQDDSDSDIEIPTLNMEPDTDDEDEDD